MSWGFRGRREDVCSFGCGENGYILSSMALFPLEHFPFLSLLTFTIKRRRPGRAWAFHKLYVLYE